MTRTPPSFRLAATTLDGFEELLAEELRGLGAENVTIRTRAVQFSGNTALLYRVNLWSRLALRILKPIREFRATDEDEIYRQVSHIKWDTIFSLEQTFAINAVVNSSHFSHSQYVMYRVKDAIADQFREAYGGRPDVDTDAADIVIHTYVHDDSCIISLDSSGESLHKRGYRMDTDTAPLNEVLAAGLVLHTGWKGETCFLDPMCGAGTIPVEAAMIVANFPPGRNRAFGFQRWRDYQPALWEKEMAVAAESTRTPSVPVIGSDLSSTAISNARKNVVRAGVDDIVRLSSKDFFTRESPAAEGTLVMNPPYGERMPEEDIEGFYAQIGDRLKEKYTGWDAWIFSGNIDAIKRVGLRARERHTFFNGPIECKYHKFPMYRGSKKSPTS